MKICFVKDTTLLINNTTTSSYEDEYKEFEFEYVDLIDETDTHIHVQFHNGETSSIPKDSIVFISHKHKSS